MADMMQRAAEHYAVRLNDSVSRTVRYRRENAFLDILVTIGNTVFTVEDKEGLFQRIDSRDFLIVEPNFPAIFDLPQRGDIIEEQNIELTTTFIYEVNSPGSEPVWRWSDDMRRVYRIHTKEINIR